MKIKTKTKCRHYKIMFRLFLLCRCLSRALGAVIRDSFTSSSYALKCSLVVLFVDVCCFHFFLPSAHYLFTASPPPPSSFHVFQSPLPLLFLSSSPTFSLNLCLSSSFSSASSPRSLTVYTTMYNISSLLSFCPRLTQTQSDCTFWISQPYNQKDKLMKDTAWAGERQNRLAIRWKICDVLGRPTKNKNINIFHLRTSFLS